ncbi:MAG: hypothetical protein DMF62_05010 [Acidobacteria bacterium]|nr:MAG: hypothetical protein DMF62_05010 [Acidobacteriota bacterium]
MTDISQYSKELIVYGNRITEIGHGIAVGPPPEPIPVPPDPIPVPPAKGRAKFGWTWATPRTATSWGNPLTAAEATAVQGAARSYASHVLGWGPDESLASLRSYWDWRKPDLMLLAKAPQFAKIPDGNPSKGDPYDEWGPSPSAWPQLYDLWATYVKEFKPKRVIPWSECRGSAPWGFWDNRPQTEGGNRWAVDHYCNFWNTGEAKLRAASPGVLLGGPYVGMSSWGVTANGTKGTLDNRDLAMISGFMDQCKYDFIAVDGGIDLRPGYNLPGGTPEQHVEKMLDVYRWVRAKTDKPFVWVETYMSGLVGTTVVKEHARAWPYLLDEADKIGGDSTWYAWGAQRDMPDIATLNNLATR